MLDERSRKLHLGTGPQKKCAGKFLTGDLFAVEEVDAREVHEARERAEIA